MPSGRWIGPLCAVIGVLGFSFKAILIKLAYREYPVDAITLLALRMLYAAPMFVAMAAWAQRSAKATPTSRADWLRLVWLGCIGYYLASLLDFMGLEYITASLERLVLFLYPTIVVLFSAWLLGRPVTRRAVMALVLSYAGIAFVFWHDLRIAANAGATLTGGALVFASAILYALYLVQAGGVIARLGSSHARLVGVCRRAIPADATFKRTRRAAFDPRHIDCNGDLFHRAADVADRRVHPPDGRQCGIAGRIARPRLHDRPWRDDPG